MTRRLYAGKDFQTLKSEIKSRLSQRFPDIVLDFQNDLTLFIVELLSYGVESLNFFLDVQANEAFPATAQLRDSIDRHAVGAGYNPQGAVPASGELDIKPPDGHQRAINLDQGFQWVSDQGLVYEVIEDYLWPVGDDAFKQISLSQVETRTEVFTSDGSRFQTFNIQLQNEDSFLSYRSPVVTVAGEQWEEVDAIGDLDEEVYRVSYTSSTPYIEFGDGAVGNIPAEDAEIRVEYKVTQGREGIVAAGSITSPVEPLVVAGEQVELTIDESTGEMLGGDGPESIETIRAKLPKFRHSDGAVVTNSDVDGLLRRYRDPTYGAVAAATAFVVKSLDNDVESLSLIRSIEAILEDESQTLNSVISQIDSAADDIDLDASDIDTIASNIQTIAGAGGDVTTLVSEMRTFSDQITDSANNGNERAVSIASISDAAKVAAQDAQRNADDVRSIFAGIAIGGSNQLTQATYDDIEALLNELDTNISNAISLALGGPVIEAQTQQIVASMTTVKNRINEVKTRLDSIDDAADNVDAEITALSSETTSINTLTSSLRDQADILGSQIVAPWDDIEVELQNLRTHLDGVFADACGPNLVTVPILSYDADGFYVAPSVGLQNSFEDYINERNEPSVVFSVVDGSFQLVLPNITVVFRVGEGFSANVIRGAIESNLFAVLKDRDFGDDLYLADLYASLRSIEGVEFLNVTIDSFSPSPQDGVEIDSDGNLVVAEGNVISRPSITYFKKLPDGSKELI